MEGVQSLHALEESYGELQKELNDAEREKSRLADEVNTLETEANELRRVAKEATRSQRAAIENLGSHERQLSRLEAKSQEESERAASLEAQVKELLAARAADASSLAEARAETRAVERKLQIESRGMIDTFAIERTKNELNETQAHAKWLETKLEERVEELRRFKSLASTTEAELRTSSDEARVEADRLRLALDSARRQATASAQEIEDIKAKERSARSALAELEASASADLRAEKRLAVALVDEADAAKKDADRARKRAKEAEEKLAASQATFRLELDRATTKADHLMQSARDEADTKIAELEQELAAATSSQLLLTSGEENLSNSSPKTTAGLTSSLSTAALFERLSIAERDAEAARAELRRNEIYMERVVAEIEKKKAVWDKERQDKKAALSAYDALAKKHAELLRELDHLKQEANSIDSARNEWKHEQRALEQSNKDLAAQVCELLAGNRRRNPELLAEGPTETYISVHGISSEEEAAVTEQLVVFSDLKQMQARNTQLLRVVRRLSEQLAAASKPGDEDQDEARVLDGVLNDLEELKQHRETQDSLLEELTKQRDTYRAQLDAIRTGSENQGDPHDKPGGDEMTTTEKQDHTTLTTIEKHQIAALEDAARRAAEETAKSETARRFSEETLAEKRQELQEAKKRELRLVTDLEHERSRSLRLETAEISAREAQKFSEQRADEARRSATAWEKAATDARREATELEERCRLSAQRQHLAETAKLRAETACSNAELKAQSLELETKRLASALEGIHRLESAVQTRSEADTSELRDRLEKAEQALASERKLVLAERESAERRATELERRAGVAETQLLEAETTKAKLRAEADSATKALETIRYGGLSLDTENKTSLLAGVNKQTPNPAITKTHTATAPSMTQAEDIDLGLTAVLRADADGLRAELEAATAALASEQSRCDDLTAVAKSHEAALVESRAAAEQLRKRLDAEVKRLEERCGVADERVQSAVEALEAAEAAFSALRLEANSSAELGSALKLAKDAAEAEASTARIARDAASAEAQRAADAVNEARDRYSRELQVHAAHVDALNAATACCDAAVRETEAERAAKTTDQDQNTEALEAKQLELEAEIEKVDAARRRVAGLERQNELLHSQLALATAQIERLDEGLVSTRQEMTEDNAAPQQQRVQELQEIVDFVRREKELAEAKQLVAERGRQREAARAAAADEALAAVQSERDDLIKQVRSSEHEQHVGSSAAALSQLSLLRESNAALRAEAADTKQKLEKQRSLATELRSRLAPSVDEIAGLKAKVQGLEQTLASRDRELQAWQKRVDLLVAQAAKRRDELQKEAEAELNSVKEAHRKACQELEIAIKSKAVSDRRLLLLDASWARDVAQAAARSARSARADLLHRQALSKAKAALEVPENRQEASDAVIQALKDEIARLEAKLRKAAGVMRGFKTKIADLTTQNDQLKTQKTLPAKSTTTPADATPTSPPPPPTTTTEEPQTAAAAAPPVVAPAPPPAVAPAPAPAVALAPKSVPLSPTAPSFTPTATTEGVVTRAKAAKPAAQKRARETTSPNPDAPAAKKPAAAPAAAPASAPTKRPATTAQTQQPTKKTKRTAAPGAAKPMKPAESPPPKGETSKEETAALREKIKRLTEENEAKKLAIAQAKAVAEQKGDKSEAPETDSKSTKPLTDEQKRLQRAARFQEQQAAAAASAADADEAMPDGADDSQSAT